MLHFLMRSWRSCLITPLTIIPFGFGSSLMSKLLAGEGFFGLRPTGTWILKVLKLLIKLGVGGWLLSPPSSLLGSFFQVVSRPLPTGVQPNIGM